MLVQDLGIVQPVANVTGVAMEIEYSGDFGRQWTILLNEIGSYLNIVLGGQEMVLVRQPKGARQLDKDSRTLRLLRIVQEGVLVMIEGSN